jgi:Zinc carboxypeptidase
MSRALVVLCVSCVWWSLPSAPALARPPLTTTGERTGYHSTGRYQEVLDLCKAYVDAYPARARCVTFGITPEGRPMVALILSSDGVLWSQAAKAKGRPILFLQGGIHAGEIDGKDAGFLALRELLDGKVAKGLLDQATIVFVPVYNVDGHERVGPYHRPNQRGPRETGFRATAQNLNLNRDYVKADAPETRHMLSLLEEWDPIVYVDMHSTDGAKFEHDVALVVSPEAPRADGLDEVANGLAAALVTRLTQMGHLPLAFYPAFRKREDPSSGFEVESSPPRFGTAYWGVRNRLGILVETHSWRPYPHRVKSTRNVLVALFEQAKTDLPTWTAAAVAADQRSLAGQEVVLYWGAKPGSRVIDFRGYAYEVSQSELSGQKRIVYDERKPQLWKVPFYDQWNPILVATAPGKGGGYVIPAARAAEVAERLGRHGIVTRRLPSRRKQPDVWAFRIERVTERGVFEGRYRGRFDGVWRKEGHVLPPGSLFVPIDQPRALLVMHMLEPSAPDSLSAWGMLDAHLEEKEYMEDYVLEDEARRMLAEDKALAEAWRKALEDPAFAKNPRARMRFFYERHPSFEQETTVVPVFRVDGAP